MIETPSMTQQAISELSQFNEMISTVIPYAELTVEANGIGQVEEAHKAVKKLSASIEKKRKELKAGALEYGRTVDSIAKQLSEKVDGIESRLKAERDAFDAVEKAAKLAKEQEKQAAKQRRLNEMVAAGIPVDLAAADLPDDEWMWWLSKAKKQAAEIAERIEEERRHNERRQKLATRIARMEALGVAIGSVERVEQLSDSQFEADYATAKKFIDDRRASEEAEQKRQAEELRVRAAELEAERKALEAERAAKLKEDAIERQKIEAEREELRRKEREAEAARKAALAAPELEKLETVLKAIRDAAGKSVLEAGEPAWCVHLDEGLTKLAIDMRLVVRQCAG